MVNWHEIPFVRLLLPLMVGILFCLYLDFNSPFIIGLSLALLVLTVAIGNIRGWYRFRWLYGFLLSLFLISTGYQVTWFYNELNHSDHFSKMELPRKPVMIAMVNEKPVRKNDWVRLEVKVFQAGGGIDSLKGCSGNLLLNISKDSVSETIKYGDILVFNSFVSPVDPPANPDAFDYQRYLHYQNIHHQSYLRNGGWARMETGKGNFLYSKAIDLQSSFLRTLQKHLTTSDELAVGSALILGYRDEIPENIQMAYSQTGAMHVLAVSGLHVGIVFLIVNFLLKRVRSRDTRWIFTKMVINLAVIWSFALITGASPSVIRAATMFSFVNVGQALRRRTNIYNTLAASAFFLLLYNPFWIASVSFQLSYLAVFGIVYFQPKFEKLVWIENRFLTKIWALICVSLGAQLMTLPLTLYYFNQFPAFFWLSSLILVPSAGFVLGGGLLLFFMENVWSILAEVIGKGLWGLLWICNQVVFLIQQLPGAVKESISVSGLITVVLYLAIISFMLAISFRRMRWVVTALGLFVVISINYAFRELRQVHQRKIVVYSVNKNTLIDFVIGNNTYSLEGKGIGSKTLEFTTDGYRTTMGIEKVNSFQLSDSLYINDYGILVEQGVVQFMGKNLVILDKPVKITSGQKIQVDYILLRNSPRMSLEELRESFGFELLIFDSSNTKWQVEKWKLACEQLDLPYYDVGANGAWVADIMK